MGQKNVFIQLKVEGQIIYDSSFEVFKQWKSKKYPLYLGEDIQESANHLTAFSI
jgi:hypothetical protein